MEANQLKNNHVTTTAIAVILLLISNLLSWFTLRGGGPTFFSLSSFTVNGFAGNISLGPLTLPIWLVSLILVGPIMIAGLNRAGITSLPEAYLKISFIVGVIFLLVALGIGLFHTQASLGLGPIVATVGAAMGGTILFRTSVPSPTPTSST